MEVKIVLALARLQHHHARAEQVGAGELDRAARAAKILRPLIGEGRDLGFRRLMRVEGARQAMASG